MDKDSSERSRYQLLQTDRFSEEALLENHPYLDGATLGSLENHPGQSELRSFLQPAGASGVPSPVLCYLCSPAASLRSQIITPVFIIYYY